MPATPKPYKRPGSTNYWFRTTVGGKEHRESTGTANFREAQSVINKRMAELREPQTGDGLTYYQAVGRFFDHVDGLKPQTLAQYRAGARTLGRFMGNIQMKNIDQALLKSFVRVRKNEVSNTAIRRNLAFLSTLFTYMQEMYDDAPEVNPVIQFNKRRLKENKRTRWLSEAEVQKLIDACQTEMQECIIYTALLTGMRHSELANMVWADSGLETGVYLHLQDREVHVVESKSSEPRVVPLADDAVRTLSRTPRHSGAAHVFWHTNGQGFHDFKNTWQGVRRRSGLTDVKFHDLRHTFATRWVRAGGDERHLQRILGHADPQMVQRYGHLASKDLHGAVRTVVGSSTQ